MIYAGNSNIHMYVDTIYMYVYLCIFVCWAFSWINFELWASRLFAKSNKTIRGKSFSWFFL